MALPMPRTTTPQPLPAPSPSHDDIAATVAFLGPEGTFTAEAARTAFPTLELVPLPTIPDVIDAVRARSTVLGVIPIENAIEGSVNLTLDELAFGPKGAWIRGEVTLPISMNLIARAGTTLAEVRVVRTHPVALGQSRRWLRTHLPAVETEVCSSTAEAVRQIAEGVDRGVAALGPSFAAQHYGLGVLAADVQDLDDNATRFVVLGPSMAAATGADRTSIVVTFGEDRPGLLLRVLQEFALRGINLTKVESRPTKRRLGQYALFIDVAGHPGQPRVAEALRSVHRHVEQLRVLGAYPRADGVVDVAGPQDDEQAYSMSAAWFEALMAAVDAQGG